MNTFGFLSLLICIYLQYSEAKNPARWPPCMYGKPLKNPVTNKTLDCWSAGTPDICPYSYECKYDPAGIYSVCCRKEYEYNPCIIGRPLEHQITNLTVKCGFKPGNEECPSSHVCKIDPVEAYAVCCPKRPRALTSLFTQRKTSHSIDENILLCNSNTPCPFTHECVKIRNGQPNGYCKIRENTEQYKVINPCGSGLPYSYSDGQEPVFCGKGKNHEDCPLSYECRIDSANNYAVCCPRERKFNPCNLEEPYMIGNQTIYCGDGPKHKDCPKSYSCKIDPDGAYAICCREYNLNNGNQ